MEQKKNKWYIVNVVAGQEGKVALEIKAAFARKGLLDNIEVLVPTKNVTRVKKGKKIQELQKLFPGYVFINTSISSEIQNLINSVPKVMGFLGRKNNPEEVSEEKMQNILGLVSEKPEDEKLLAFEIGEVLKVMSGPFESFAGVVEDFDFEKQKLRISISIFGRATSVEMDVDQVEKVVSN